MSRERDLIRRLKEGKGKGGRRGGGEEEEGGGRERLVLFQLPLKWRGLAFHGKGPFRLSRGFP